MPRIRTLKPDFFTSPGVAEVDFPVRIFYQALWCNADDFGIGETNFNTLLGLAFPDSDGFTAQDVRRFCADCARAFGTTFYTVRGRHYYAIPTWEKHQKLERRADRRKYPSPNDPDASPDQRIFTGAQSAPKDPRKSGAESGEMCAGTGEQGNRGTGEDDYGPLPPEPPLGPYDAIETEVVVEPPRHVDNPPKPAKRFASSAAKTLVRQVLGGDYPRSTVERLGVQVDKLVNENHPDAQIRAALREWEQRPNCDRPEYLPTVLGDLVKASRVNTAANVTAFDRKKAHNASVFAALGDNPDQPELMP